MRGITVRDRLQYRFDSTMAAGTRALIGWLFLLSALMIALVALLVLVTGIAPAAEDGSRPGIIELLWFTLMRTLDAGTVGGDSGSWTFLLAMLAITMGGIFLVSTLIGVLTSGIESKIEQLRKGRSMVIEHNHIVVLGWSPQIFTLISELVIANANQKRSCIAILAEKDKVEMEDAIRDQVGPTGRTRVVCRTGSPLDLADLEIVSPHAARSIVILAPEEGDADSAVIKAILALTNNPNRRAEPYHIVAEIRDQKNLEVARMVGRDEAQLVLVGDLISRIAVQSCRQPGLSAIYNELLDFDGDEIYLQPQPELAGKTFGEALLAYEDSTLIGLLQSGQVLLNPAMDTPIGAGDQVIVIAADDDRIRIAASRELPIYEQAIRGPVSRVPDPERTLILGWNKRVPAMIRELDLYVAPGSAVLVVAEQQAAAEAVEALNRTLSNLSAAFREGDTTSRATLDALDVPAYRHIITVSDSASEDPQQSDARTLITLLHLRAIAEQSDHPFSIVSEMQDIRNRKLAEITRADDFIISASLVSLLLSQIAENRYLEAVFADLFDADGCEIYLRPASDYIEPGARINVATLSEAARRRAEVLIGYQIHGQVSDPASRYGIRLNPPKSQALTLAAEDRVVVLATG